MKLKITAVPRHEAVGLFLECAAAHEIEGRLSGEAWITQFEADYAQAKQVRCSGSL